jgi:cyclohexa-1,5-dienecarbonyl-CoA hydratase
MSDYRYVRSELIEDGGLLRVVIDNPKGNVLTSDVLRELDAVLAHHAADRDLKLVMISGQGKHFSFGASVEEHQKDRVADMLATFHGVIRRLGNYPVATAALVNGRCLGGAFELALCTNFVLATPHAVFGCPEIKLGVFPPVLAALGPDRLGVAWTERLLLTGGDLHADRAEAVGFVTEILRDDDPDAEALGWYRSALAPLSAFSLRQALAAARLGSGIQQRLDKGIAEAECLYLERVVSSHDGNEGIEAFIAKRAPSWRNE